MAERCRESTDWIRAHEERYFGFDAEPEAFDAAQHVLMARSALRVGRREMALCMYRTAMRIWRDMDERSPGDWEEEVWGTHRELADLLSHPPTPANG